VLIGVIDGDQTASDVRCVAAAVDARERAAEA
jgi:hypothetical protein